MTNSEEIKKTSSILTINQLIFKKYRLLNLISEGMFCQIYIAININNKKYYAVKVENTDSNYQLLEQEAYNLYSIKNLGIPEFITFGRNNNYNILIEELLGKSLFEIFKEYNNSFSIQDICLIAIQLIDRLEWIHSKTIIHRDLKPENYLMGRENNNNIIYLTEFGLCTKYCSSKTGKHIIPGFKGTFTGTLKYCSANAQRGNRQSRRDDIESLGYSILYFMKGKLPWEHLNQKFNEKELYIKTYAMKKYMPIERLCKGLPSEMEEYFKYVRNLKFQEEPNYDYLKNLFKNILKNNGINNYEELNLSWVDKAKNFKLKKKRTLSPNTRLYLKIKSQLNQEIDSENNHTHIIKDNKTPNKSQYAQSLSFTQVNNNKTKSQIENNIKINNINQNRDNFLSSSDFENNKKNEDKKEEKLESFDKEKENQEKQLILKTYPNTIELYNKKNKNNIKINKKEEIYQSSNIEKFNNISSGSIIRKKYLNAKKLEANQLYNNINRDIDNLQIKKVNPKLNHYYINRYNTRYTTNSTDNYNNLKLDSRKIYPNNNAILKPAVLNNSNIHLTNNNHKDINFFNLEQNINYFPKNNEYKLTDNNIVEQKGIIKNINNNNIINNNMNLSRGEKNDNIINDNLMRINNKYQNINKSLKNNNN